MDALVFGDGPMGRALTSALEARGDKARILGRPPGAGHAASTLGQTDLVFEASAGGAVRRNLQAALLAGCRRVVIATTGWDDDREPVASALRDAGGAAVWAPNFSIGTALFTRLVARAASLYGTSFDPFIVEWHRRAKRDRPSGTAQLLADRFGARRPEITSVRAGSSPGMHLVGFDAPGESVELRITARDRSAYAVGALAAADWLLREPRTAGLHPFDEVVDDLVATPIFEGASHDHTSD